MLKRFIHRHQPKPVTRYILIAGLGAALAIIILGALTQYGRLPLLIAPFGATCVLLFAAHTSPLSQPINIVGGHLVAGFIGIATHLIWPGNFVMAGLAVGISVMAMMTFRVLHPPAGATSLVAYVTANSFMYLLFPIGIGSIVIVAIGVVYHKFTKGIYPSLPPK